MQQSYVPIEGYCSRICRLLHYPFIVLIASVWTVFNSDHLLLSQKNLQGCISYYNTHKVSLVVILQQKIDGVGLARIFMIFFEDTVSTALYVKLHHTNLIVEFISGHIALVKNSG